MRESKKVILFVVEGVTDETTLGLILSKIIHPNYVIKFIIIGGDITTKTGINSNNCINRLVEEVKQFIAKDYYKKTDISEIIHLVDLDGTFVNEDHIVQNTDQLTPNSHIIYTENEILTDVIDRIVTRNEQKAHVLDKYIDTKHVYGGIPYHIYYFSCNLEHVLYNRLNLPDENKYLFAKEVQDLYAEHPTEFIEFMNSDEIAAKPEYHAAWDYVKQEQNSLKRCSNFNLFLNSIV